MKKILRIALAAAVLVSAAACSKTEEEPAYLAVTAFNVDGLWKLSEWSDASLDGTAWAYIELDRRDGKFTAYSTIETSDAIPVIETGFYAVNEEESSIWGYYEFDNTKWWKHKYIISELTADRMLWTAEDDASEYRVYVRADSLPDGVLQDSSSDTGSEE